jgi:hypothetical protein
VLKSIESLLVCAFPSLLQSIVRLLTKDCLTSGIHTDYSFVELIGWIAKTVSFLFRFKSSDNLSEIGGTE